MTAYARKLFFRHKLAPSWGSVGIIQRFNRQDEVREQGIFKMEQ